MKIKKGDSVECKVDKFKGSETDPFPLNEIILPKEGERYTVRDVVENDYGIGLRFEEIINRKYYYDDIGRAEEPTFNAERFKKIKGDYNETQSNYKSRKA